MNERGFFFFKKVTCVDPLVVWLSANIQRISVVTAVQSEALVMWGFLHIWTNAEAIKCHTELAVFSRPSGGENGVWCSTHRVEKA